MSEPRHIVSVHLPHFPDTNQMARSAGHAPCERGPATASLMRAISI